MQLAELTPDNVRAACSITLRPGQERFVAPVAESIAEAYVSAAAWPRVIVDDGRVVGFVMASFDPDSEVAAAPAGIWRLNIAGVEQGKGFGRFAAEAVAAEARRRGLERITVLWMRGEDGPEEFYQRLGFRPTGEEISGQVVGVLELS